LGRIAGYAAGILGLPLAGYTGVLIACTAVPVWQGGRRALPPLFLASSAASAGALLSLLPVGRRGKRVARRFEAFGNVAELSMGVLFAKEVGRTPRAARPLGRGLSGTLWGVSRGLGAASLLASVVGSRAASGALTLAGAMGLRAAVFLAGKASARDPRATFRQQREA
jgi:formate-dependent nitrite reductase membrane component NrfD